MRGIVVVVVSVHLPKENKMKKSWLLKIRDIANLGIANDTYTQQEMIQKLEQIYDFTWECEKKLKAIAKEDE